MFVELNEFICIAQVPVENYNASASKYALHLYGEGVYFSSIKNLNVNGIPVLFVSGHGGSYMQVKIVFDHIVRF